ncbi:MULTISPECIES: hypothetical protein [unclassified Shewanella]|uniref:hypothetical protein n=1 Tax=unclassified Shewanella TaxID=196818 RepID=UPI001BC66ED1|nr:MULTISPECIES: hypothetical protein [unclassified Shewanella]GIU11250.1 hypothetical protein TUM4444_16840 [Shewanella sp. MBTL60-112-B1]GIU30943.1 hypothetical protein TUM4445_14820 [Shewanella sp. MBTL60-112-B2]
MENSSTRHEMDSQMDSVTITNGYWYYFNDQDVRITAHGSGYSGKETIYVNDEVVSDKRNLVKMNSCHKFCHLGNDYEVRFKVTSLMKATVECSLYRNNQHLATETKAFLSKDNQSVKKQIFMCFLAGLVFGGLFVLFMEYFSG